MDEGEKGWQEWKNTLATAVNIGNFVGMNENTIEGLAYRIGNFLAARVDPANREQRVLKELWDAANENQRRVLAQVITQMVSDGQK